MDSNAVQDIKQSITIDAPIQQVWSIVSSSEGMTSWFMENDMKPVVGHEFHLQSPFGPSPCKVLEVDEPNKLSFSWDTDGWNVSFILNELDKKTEFTLIHSGWKDDEVVPKAGEKSSVIRERMNQGWIGIIAKLKEVVEQ